jgi:UrcA family protein
MKKFASNMLLLGGLGGLVGAGVASAATADEAYSDVPAVVVRYHADMLATDSGARALYRRLTQAAEQVCPRQSSNTRLPNAAITKCRQEALAAAVNKIHNQRLAAVDAASSKSG